VKTRVISLPDTNEIPDFKAAQRVCKELESAGHEVFLVGGCVRDLVMGLRPKDYDITTSALPQDVMKLFPKSFPVGVQFGVVKVWMRGFLFEVATFRGEDGYYDGRHPTKVWFSTLEQDLKRRDFTMNALVMNALTGEITDTTNGLEAISQGIIDAIGDPFQRFEEDKLRMLRAIRFSAQLGFAIHNATADAIRALASEIVQVSKERIREEMEKLLGTKDPAKGLVLALNLGLLIQILPEIAAYGEKRLNELGLCLPKTGNVLTKWAILLKDAGSDVAYQVINRLKNSNKACSSIKNIIDGLKQMSGFNKLTLSARKRLIRADEFAFIQDAAMACETKIGIAEQEIRAARALLDESGQDDLFPPVLLTGDDIMAMGYKPGPAFAKVIRALEDAMLANEIKTRQDAANFVRYLMEKEI